MSHTLSTDRWIDQSASFMPPSTTNHGFFSSPRQIPCDQSAARTLIDQSNNSTNRPTNQRAPRTIDHSNKTCSNTSYTFRSIQHHLPLLLFTPLSRRRSHANKKRRTAYHTKPPTKPFACFYRKKSSPSPFNLNHRLDMAQSSNHLLPPASPRHKNAPLQIKLPRPSYPAYAFPS